MHDPVVGKSGLGRISYPLLELVNVNRMPFTSAAVTPPGMPGELLDVREPVIQMLEPHPVVHTSTWTRLAPCGKSTLMLPLKMVASKKSTSASVRTIRFR